MRLHPPKPFALLRNPDSFLPYLQRSDLTLLSLSPLYVRLLSNSSLTAAEFTISTRPLATQ
jgi:hypothetical protein